MIDFFLFILAPEPEPEPTQDIQSAEDDASYLLIFFYSLVYSNKKREKEIYTTMQIELKTILFEKCRNI